MQITRKSEPAKSLIIDLKVAVLYADVAVLAATVPTSRSLAVSDISRFSVGCQISILFADGSQLETVVDSVAVSGPEAAVGSGIITFRRKLPDASLAEFVSLKQPVSIPMPTKKVALYGPSSTVTWFGGEKMLVTEHTTGLSRWEPNTFTTEYCVLWVPTSLLAIGDYVLEIQF